MRIPNYSAKLRHNVVCVFSIFNGDVITPHLGNYRTDMTISLTALNQSKLYFQQDPGFAGLTRARQYTGNKFAKGE